MVAVTVIRVLLFMLDVYMLRVCGCEGEERGRCGWDECMA